MAFFLRASLVVYRGWSLRLEGVSREQPFGGLRNEPQEHNIDFYCVRLRRDSEQQTNILLEKENEKKKNRNPRAGALGNLIEGKLQSSLGEERNRKLRRRRVCFVGEAARLSEQ